MSSVLARRQLRLILLTALQTLAGVTVRCPGDWETAPGSTPEVKLRVPNESKVSVAKTEPGFTTTVSVEIMATVTALTAEAAQDALELLGAQVEDVVFGCVAMVRLIQQVASVNTQSLVTNEGNRHIGRSLMTVGLEVFERFDPIEIDPSLAVALTTLDLHADLIRPFDAAGTYASPPFPAAVAAAPRAAGPDGRDEGHLQIILPT